MEKKLYKILLCAFNSVLLYHYAFYMTPLAYVGMVTSCLIGFVSVRKCLLIGVGLMCWMGLSVF